PTEWPNRTRYDVVYMPNSDTILPILVEVQHTLDNNFIVRLMSYGISAIRHHSSMPPIILEFVTSTVKYDVGKRMTKTRIS
ncbi:hypothetical protein BGW37DRAFT_402956, partial [Umbelopsis sp. PMI_123]